MSVLENLAPKSVFDYFEKICSVPHGSGNTKQISDLVVSMAREMNGVEVVSQDEMNNIILKKSASAGYENEPTVILQGHLDMVCAKNADCPIDMAKEPIQIDTDGKYVFAKGTSLGGDDGIAIAAALALLSDDTIQHPALEIVLTVDEEIGMLGANGLDCSVLQGRTMLNLDSEAAGVFTCGCAGGVRVSGKIPCSYETVQENETALQITVEGLSGGHSGEMISLERANANILMGRLLYTVSQEIPFRLAEIDGGKFDNVICPACVSSVLVKAENVSAFTATFAKIAEKLRAEYTVTDPKMRIQFVQTTAKNALTLANTEKILDFLCLIPNGVQARESAMLSMVETSLNLGILHLTADGLDFDSLIRSSVNSRREMLLQKLKTLTQIFGGTVLPHGEYSAWQYRQNSDLRDKLCNAYFAVTGKKAIVNVIHAGVECGIFTAKLPDLDCVSCGPTILDIHSPKERIDVASVADFWNVILAVLAAKK